jgi:hypothetical protein
MLIPSQLSHANIETLTQCKALLTSQIGRRYRVSLTPCLSDRHPQLGLLTAIPSSFSPYKPKVAKVKNLVSARGRRGEVTTKKEK